MTEKPREISGNAEGIRTILPKYFREPTLKQDLPQEYLKEGFTERSLLLVRLLEKYATRDAKILELGCGIGRNLDFLRWAGFENLTGIEINERAIELLQRFYPKTAECAKIYVTPVEDVIRDFSPREFDVVFAMAFLEHIPEENAWVFSEIVRITKDLLITLEDEEVGDWHKIPRNYKHIFEPLGMEQIRGIGTGTVFEGCWCEMTTRVFRKRQIVATIPLIE